MAPPEYVIQALLDGLDHVAREMERKWGVGRLRLLVGDFLCAKFDAQKNKLDAAVATGSPVYVRTHAEGMKRAWVALDRAATEAGLRPLSPEVWECVLPSTGEVVSLVRTDAEAQHICRSCRVFTLDEIATVLDGLPEVLEAKEVFPDATVTRLGPRKPLDWVKGDELPF